jgi:cyclic dehypoxanthinyl futalosine synthase
VIADYVTFAKVFILQAMDKNLIYTKALQLEFLNAEEAIYLYEQAPLSELMFIANELRKKHVPGDKVTWMIDRNVNITNVCIARCKFCNFHRVPGHSEAYITTIEEYKNKIDTLFELGGNQVLLQGGLHPKLGLDFYTNLFKELKSLYPTLKLHALGPAEIVHISKLENKSYRDVLEALVDAGLDSLPGAGAEILCDRVRGIVSPGKCKSDEWLNVMREAHKMNLLTSATMMFGHAETLQERIEHIIKIRQVQSEKPEGHYGFMAFISWPFQDEDTRLKTKYGIKNSVSSVEYLKTLAISRILLPNIKNIQASWLTVGKNVGQIALHAGANDFGSIMIEENVVSVAGATNSFDANGIQQAIRDAGFEPSQRDQKYDLIERVLSK